ncbi:NADH-quinone oxidoreductase subunit NuoK [bacterium endosymbiont of Pedicinus badii]|uniref:NADH-quinone oxidoreductase subunit NuoK n=1 Tax=bacterium endosymbiont of Pedicinus badii TaxID=1719126 RepID=UPI0009BA07AF|nr:NADH-quinone oxidoreductase subunit K [bacterium endosymbiont of Pedicinus badii]OQM34448.1 hypothetical protein AOQ89_00985 [bacterium endosymbiont of Pedicinus badii]
MISLQNAIIFCSFLFFLGFLGIIIKKNLIHTLIGIEIMTASSGILFVFSGKFWNQIDGEIIYILMLSFSVIESIILLSLLFFLYKNKTIHLDELSEKDK